MASKDKTKNLINKATTDNRDPPSGYLLQELAKRTTSIQECQTIEDLIVKKLQKKQPYVKYKALRVIKYLCENGSSNWRRAWQRNTDKLRDAQQFRGPPDPIYGDAPYQQVRKAAKDAMQSVFQSSQIDNTNIKARIKSIDGTSAYNNSDQSSKFGSGSTGVFSIPKKSKAPSAPNNKWDNRGGAPTKQMQGFGNTNYVPNAKGRRTTFEPLKSSGGYSNPAVLSGSNPHSSGKLDNRGHGHKRKRGTVGGGWGPDPSDVNDNNDDDDSDSHDHDNEYSADRFPSNNNNENSVSSSHNNNNNNSKRFGGNIRSSNRGSNRSDGHYEQKWVNDIIRGGGIGAKIPGIDKYVDQFENLSKSHILEFLDDKLEDGDWRKQGKTLTLINALITQARSGSVVIEYFSECPDNIQLLTKANKSILRRNANAIMNYLDVEDDEDDDDGNTNVNSVIKKKQQQPPQASGDLLNLNTQTAPVQEQTVSDNNDILSFTQDLGGDDDEDDDGDMFSGLGGGDGSGGGVVSGNNVASLIPDDALPTKEELQANANKRKASDYDFLNDMVSNINVKQDNQVGNDNGILQMGFSTNNNNNNNNNGSGVSAAAASGGGSAFGFNLGNNNNANAGNNGSNNNNNNMQQSNVGGGNSAFGFDLGGRGGAVSNNANNNNNNVNMNMNRNNNNNNNGMGMNRNMNNQSQQSSFNFMNSNNGNNNNNNNMNNNQGGYVQNMMQTNAVNRQYTQNNMSQLNSMMNQMNMANNNNNNNNNISAFQQTIQSVAQPQQQPVMMQQTFNHNDPFAQMMSGAAPAKQATTTARQSKPAMDPFSDFSLKAMK